MGRLNQIEDRFRVVSNAILIVAIGSLLLLFIWDVINLEIFDSGFKNNLVHFGGPVIVMTMMLIVLRSKPSTRIKFTILLVATATPLYVTEYLITDRVRISEPGIVKHHGSLSRIDTIIEMRLTKNEVWPSMTPYILRGSRRGGLKEKNLLSLGGIANVWTVFCNEGNKIAYYKSDRFGFNNAPGSWFRKIKLLILGDSFMQGVCVKQSATTGGILRSRGMNTVSLGMVSNGPLSELAGLKEYISEAKPEYVVWSYFEGNDLDDLRSEAVDPVLSKYLDETDFSQNLTERVSEIDQMLRNYVEQDGTIKKSSKYSSPLLSWFKLRALRNRITRLHKSYFLSEKQTQKRSKPENDINSQNSINASLKLFSRVLEIAKQESEKHGAKLFFVYLPSWQGLTGVGNTTSRKHILNMVENMEVPLIDVMQRFQKYDDPLSLFTKTTVEYGHYTEEGYELVASAILEVVDK